MREIWDKNDLLSKIKHRERENSKKALDLCNLYSYNLIVSSYKYKNSQWEGGRLC